MAGLLDYINGPQHPSGLLSNVNNATPEAYATDRGGLLGSMLHGLLNIPQRAFESSNRFRETGEYDPGPILEAAMLPMGTGAIAGVPVKGAEAVLGAGPTRGLFDYSGLSKVPDVPQFDLPRNVPPRGVPQRVIDITNDAGVRDKMLNVISEGQKMGGANWYNAEPLRE